MDMDRRFEFSISARVILFSLLGAFLFLVAAATVQHVRAKELSAKKTEYRRRLRFLGAATKAYGLASDIMNSYGMGDTAFGLARNKAISAQKSLESQAKTLTESHLSLADQWVIDVYSEPGCRASLASCESELNSTEAQFSTAFDAAMAEASKYDWRPKSEQADDDPLASDQ